MTSADVRAIAALVRRARHLSEHPREDRAGFEQEKAELLTRSTHPGNDESAPPTA